MDNGVIIFVVLVFIFGILYIVIYNNLIGAKQSVAEAWSGVDVQLRRRRDLIPNIVHTVEGYATHEKELLQQITNERARAFDVNKNDITKLETIENKIDSDLKSIFAIAEAYPDLKANTTYLKLQEALVETEDQIASSRRIYNSNVADYNTKIALFPQNIVAAISHFTKSPFFQNEEQSSIQ